jgi:hypothetical protein
MRDITLRDCEKEIVSYRVVKRIRLVKVIKSKGLTVKGLSQRLMEQGVCKYPGQLQYVLGRGRLVEIEIGMWEAIRKELE